MILAQRARRALAAAASVLTLALIPAGPGTASAAAVDGPVPADLTAARAFTDTFHQDPSLDTDPFYGLNVGLQARQSPPAGQRPISYTRVSGNWYDAAPADPWCVQVSHPDHPDRMVFAKGLSAVMLGAPAVADDSGHYTVSTVVDPSVGDTTSQDWASIVLSRGHRGTGYVTGADVDLGLTVTSGGRLSLFHGGGGEAPFWSGTVAPAADYAVSLTVSTGADRSVALTVNGTTLNATAPAGVTRWPSSAFLYLGAYLDAGTAKVTTFGDGAGNGLSVSRVDTAVGASAKPLVDTFDGASATAADFGLNQGLSARQPSLVSANYSAESGIDGLVADPAPGAVQVNTPAHPNVLSFPRGTAAVRLTKPATADLDGRYTVHAVLTPVVGSTTSADWASLAVSRASNGTGAVDAPDVALGLRVRADGGLALYQGGAATALPGVPAAPSYAVSVAVASGSAERATVTVNGTTVFSGPTAAELPRDGYVVLGSHQSAAGQVTTVDDLRVSMLGGLGYYGYYDIRDPDEDNGADHTAEVASWTNFNGYLRGDDPRLDFLDRCLPASCVIDVNHEVVSKVDWQRVEPKPDAAANLAGLVDRIGSNLDKIGAVYLTDEAYWRQMTPQQVQTQADQIRAAFPGKLLIFDYDAWSLRAAGAGTNPAPRGVDIISANQYCLGRGNVQDLLALLKTKLASPDQHLMLYPETLVGPGGSDNCEAVTDGPLVKLNAEYRAAAAQDPRLVYLHPFRWTGAAIPARVPLTVAHQQATGREVVNATPTRRPSSVGVYRPSEQLFAEGSHNGATIARAVFGRAGDIPLTGHWNGPGVDTVGVYRPDTREFVLANADGTPAAPVTFGDVGDVPLAGDWNGDGRTTIGVYRKSDQTFYLSDDNASVTDWIKLGNPGWTPLVGDWDGNGTTTVAVYDPTTQYFYLNDSNRTENVRAVKYGNPGDTPVKGDWDGTGIDTVGVYRPDDRTFFGSDAGGGLTVYRATFGNTGDRPLVGNWG
ncbi:hypothetical protein ACGFZP_19205 [Kitasatospora sp. NPDC048239]|uniref:hypothetical protein n=1 Tax=Kitasatospora sp. NPDC048239 TaxID=3364046 RepID=UPI003711F2F5